MTTFPFDRPRTSEACQKSLARIQAEAERLQRLIGRMLARAEGGQQVLTFASTDGACGSLARSGHSPATIG